LLLVFFVVVFFFVFVVLGLARVELGIIGSSRVDSFLFVLFALFSAIVGIF